MALGDAYQASITHDLDAKGPLHVPFTSTDRHHFGTRDVQVNALATRMVDSSLDNVGTYGVRFDVEGSGLGFRTVRRLPAEAVEQPHGCRMLRPD